MQLPINLYDNSNLTLHIYSQNKLLIIVNYCLTYSSTSINNMSFNDYFFGSSSTVVTEEVDSKQSTQSHMELAAESASKIPADIAQTIAYGTVFAAQIGSTAFATAGVVGKLAEYAFSSSLASNFIPFVGGDLAISAKVAMATANFSVAHPVAVASVSQVAATIFSPEPAKGFANGLYNVAKDFTAAGYHATAAASDYVIDAFSADLVGDGIADTYEGFYM